MNTPGLGPRLVGRRVVVRHLLSGETGPSGGPAMTDVLGVLESWAPPVLTLRRASGELVEVPIAAVVSGKAVPPRPSVRHRVPAEEAERHANAGWVPVETAPLGPWLLRASGGYSTRANSVLALDTVDRPRGTTLRSRLEEVTRFYTARDLPPLAQVVSGSETDADLVGAGWRPARPGEADTHFQIASVAQAARALRRTGVPDGAVELSATMPSAWWAVDEQARTHGDAARRVLEGSSATGFAIALLAGRTVATGRIAGGTRDAADWAGITNVWVDHAQRRRGLGTAVMAALLDWAAERGVTTAYLQVRGDNEPALSAYERLGFHTHHRYRYLRPA